MSMISESRVTSDGSSEGESVTDVIVLAEDADTELTLRGGGSLVVVVVMVRGL